MFYYCELYKFSHFVIPILCCFNAPNNFNKKLEIVPFEKLIFCPIMVLSKCFCSIYNGHCNLGLFVFWFGLAIITLQPLHCWLARFQNISLTSTRNHAFTPWKRNRMICFLNTGLSQHAILYSLPKVFCLVLQAIWYNNICTFYFFLPNKVLLIYNLTFALLLNEWSRLVHHLYLSHVAWLMSHTRLLSNTALSALQFMTRNVNSTLPGFTK